MSANFGSDSGQDVELNITPIIDCFTVLITFLLASASFLSIGFFDAYTPGAQGNVEDAPPDTEAVMRVGAHETAVLTIKGKVNATYSFNFANKESSGQLDQELKKLHDNTTIKITQVLLSAADEVEYGTIAEAMDHISKAQFPVVVGDFQQ